MIKNNINGKIYIGKSNDIETRIKAHFSENEHNRTPHKPLYKAMKKYGQENFSIIVLEECSPELLNEREKYWIKEYNSTNNDIGYNILPGGDGFGAGEQHPGHKLTKEDVVDIRTRYNNHERKKEVEKLYSEKISHGGFNKIWSGETWPHIMPEVYTKENKEFYRHNTGAKGQQNGRAILTNEQIADIKRRKKQGEHRKDVYELYRYTGIKYKGFEAVWYKKEE